MENEEIDDAIATLQAEKAKNLKKAKSGLEEESVETKPSATRKLPVKRVQQSNARKIEPQPEAPVQDNTEMDKLKNEIENLKAQARQRMNQLPPPQIQKPKNGIPFGNKKPVMQDYGQPEPFVESPQALARQQPAKQNGYLKPTNNIADIVQRLQNDKAFVTSSQRYGAAIAASIMAKTQATPGNRVNFEDEARKVVEFKTGSYALIYKNGTPVRLAPYVWSLDQQTRRMWAVFSFNDFYGNKNPSPLKIWKTISTNIVLTPLSHTSNMADNYGKGYLTKFDEGTQFQEALTLKDDKYLEQIRSENKHFLSSALTLWMDLQSYTKAKINLRLIIIIFGIAAVCILAFYIFKTHPNILSGILPQGL